MIGETGCRMGQQDGRAQFRILMVDDDQIDRRAVRRALGERYALVEAENGEQALGMIDHSLPDCILLDYNIPAPIRWLSSMIFERGRRS